MNFSKVRNYGKELVDLLPPEFFFLAFPKYQLEILVVISGSYGMCIPISFTQYEFMDHAGTGEAIYLIFTERNALKAGS